MSVNEGAEEMIDMNFFMSGLVSESVDSFADSSLTGSTADGADPMDGEAEPEENDQQNIDDHTYNQAPLSYELQQGLRILKELMSDSNKSVNLHFLGPVDDGHPETADYYEKIKKPIWLGKMKEKFDMREYETITQFVADFRQMLENCYRFNGPDHFVSRRAQKLETMMEQKLNLLSRELREKTSITATSGQLQEDQLPMIPGVRRRARAIIPHDSTALLNQLRVEEIQKEREARKQQMMERKAVLESHIQGMMEWEDKLMEGHREEVKAMWELPSIGLLLFLCHYPLNIGEVAQFELERCIFMPRESSTLQRIMTTLLSTPFQRHKLDRTGMMPYKVWNEKLRDKMIPWFKLLKDSQDVNKVADKFGVDPFLFQVVGKKNPMRKKKFHELSLYQRVWVLKSLCDHCVESQESLVKTIESQYPEEQKDYKLGEDADGNTYLHFPQFCGADVRIYRQAYIPEPEFDEPEEEEEVVVKSPKKRKSAKKDRRDRSKSKEKTPVPKKKPKNVKTFTSEIPLPPSSRPSRLRQTIKTVLPVASNEDSSTEDDDLETTEDDGTQSESESKSESEDETESCNDSGIDNNTPFKNILRNKVMEQDNLSETSSLDSNDIWSVKRTRSGRIRFNGAMRMNNDLSLFTDGTLSENSNQGSAKCAKKKKRTDFKNLNLAKNFNGLSENENENDSDACAKEIDEKGDLHSDKALDSEMEQSHRKCKVDNEMEKSYTHDDSNSSVMNKNMSKSNDSNVIGTNEDSSTSNDFSEIESQDTQMEGNLSDNEREESHFNTISRIFDKSADGILEDSDTASSFRLKICDSSCEQNSNSSKCDNHQPSHNSNSVSEKEVVVREVTPCREMSDGTDTDVEFSPDKSAIENDNYSYEKMKTCEHEKCDKNDSGSASGNKTQSEKVDYSGFKICDTEISCSEIEAGNFLEKNVQWDTLEKVDCDQKDNVDETIEETADGEIVKTDVKTDSVDGENEIKIKIEPVTAEEDSLNKNLDAGFKVKNEDKDSDIKKESKNQDNSMIDEDLKQNIKQEPEETVKVKEEEKTDVKEEVIESDDEEDETELVQGPEIGPFELVAESVEDLKNLVEKFAEPESYTVGRGKKTKVVKPPPRKKCVVQLHNRLTYLLKELEPWEQKLIQATKKARLKMKKEYESYVEQDEDGWESDHSESTNSATEETGMEVESTPSRQPSIPKDSEDSKGAVEEGEWDISTRGRIRKRRIIPNNVEDQGISKKRKVETTLPSTTNQQFQLKPGQTTTSMVSLVTSQVKGQNPGHLLLHTSGGQTYYTGLNQQSLGNLKVLSQTKQTAHPIIQQLLQKPGMSSPRPLVSTTLSTTQAVTPVVKSAKKVATTPQKTAVSSTKTSTPSGKVQYFAANINSLPPAVIQQLIKSNALTIQPGNSPQGMILLTAVNPESGGISGAKATLTLQTPINVKTSNTVQLPDMTTGVVTTVTSSSSAAYSSSSNENQTMSQTMSNIQGQAVKNQTTANSLLTQGISNANITSVQPNKILKMTSESPVAVSSTTIIVSSASKPAIQVAPIKQHLGGAQSVPVSIPRTTAQKVVLQQSANALPTANQGVRLQNLSGLNIVNQGSYILNTGQNTGVPLQMNPTLNLGGQGSLNLGAQGTLNIGSQGLTLQQIQALALQGINIQGVSLQGSNLVVQPNAGVRIQNPATVQQPLLIGSNVSSTITSTGSLGNSAASQNIGMAQSVNVGQSDPSLKGLLNTASCSISGLCPPISPNLGSISASVNAGTSEPLLPEGSSLVPGLQISPNRSQCKYASNVTVKTLLEARKPIMSETTSENQGTIVVQSTATGVKKLKLPSKAALDSAIQTVVTEVKTSLPTANIKVPSPVTMPSIQPRRNITKTIQSMKVPIPTTPKVEAKSNGPISVQVSPPNYVQPASPVIGQPNLAVASPGLIGLNQINNAGQLMLTNLKSSSNIPTGQNIVQGYLTPQGLIIPSANLKNVQSQQKAGTLTGSLSASIEPASPLINNPSQPISSAIQATLSTLAQPIVQAGIKMQTTSALSLDGITPRTSMKNLENIMNSQPSTSIAGVSTSISSNLMTPQLVQKPLGQSGSGSQLPTGNFVYLSPSSNLHGGSQIMINANQPLTPVGMGSTLNNLNNSAALKANQSGYKQPQNVDQLNMTGNSRNLLTQSLGVIKTDSNFQSKPANAIISLPLATGKPQNLLESKVKSNVTSVSSVGNNATLLSHLNSPVLKTVNHFTLATTKADINHSSIISSVSAGQNKMMLKSDLLQKPLQAAAGQMNSLTPVVINQQCSSSEIMKQLAAAQVLGAPVQQITKQQNQTLTLANGNKLVVQMPGQNNIVTTQIENKMLLQLPGQLGANSVQLMSPSSRQASSGLPAQGHASVISTDSQQNAAGVGKVMIQVPGQTQAGGTMLFISPQKTYVLGSQASQNLVGSSVVQSVSPKPVVSNPALSNVPKIASTNVLKSVQQPTMVVQQNNSTSQAGKPNNVIQAKTVVQKDDKSTLLKAQNTDTVFKFPSVSPKSGTSPATVVQQMPQIVQKNSQTVGNVPASQVGKSSIVPISGSIVATTQTVVSSQSKNPGTPQKLFLYNINGQLVTAQGVPVTVENGILKILPQPKIQMSNFNLPKSPPFASRSQHGNVPISPKPGQTTVNAQQAYLNVLTTSHSGLAASATQLHGKSPIVPGNSLSTLSQPIKLQAPPIGSKQVIQQSQPIKLVAPPSGSNQNMSAVRNLNTVLTVADVANTNSVKQTEMSSVGIKSAVLQPGKDIGQPRPSPRFVVMPETGEQTQIVFPQPNIHSSHLNFINNEQSASSAIISASQKVATPVISQTVNLPFVQNSSPVILNHPIKINNASRKVPFVSTVSISPSMNGDHPVKTGSLTKNPGISSGDAQEAALNLLSLANQRFSS